MLHGSSEQIEGASHPPASSRRVSHASEHRRFRRGSNRAMRTVAFATRQYGQQIPVTGQIEPSHHAFVAVLDQEGIGMIGRLRTRSYSCCVRPKPAM
jgi:hypothetical protein